MKPNPQTEPPAFMTVDEVAYHTARSVRSVYRLVDSGKMPPPIRLGGLVRWERQAFERWIQDGCPNVRRGR